MRRCDMPILISNYGVHLVICLLIQMKMFSAHPKSTPKSTVNRVDPRDVYVCKDNGAAPTHFALTCDQSYSCLLTTTSLSLEEAERFTDLKSLTDDCQAPFNPQLLAKLGRIAYAQIEPFIISQHQIVELTLWFTNFTHLPPNYFCSLTNLAKLTIVNNTFKCSGNLGFSKQCDNRQCCSCNLQSLHLTKNKIESLNASSFCTFPNLTTLDLSLNAISHIDNEAFEGLENLLHLNISHNALTSLDKNKFKHLQELVLLNLSCNNLNETCFESFQLLTNLQVLVLDRNKIAKLTSCHLEGLHSLKELYLNKNHLFYLGPDLGILKSLVILDLSENKLSNISSSVFSSMDNLSILDLRQNNLTVLPFLNFSMEAELNELNVSSNRLTVLPLLTSLRKAKVVDFSHNLIENITDPGNSIFCHLTMVETMILNSNLINEIGTDAFKCNNLSSSLRNLSLKYNNLRNISGVFKYAELKSLSLNNNDIMELSLADISQSIVELDISFNRIQTFSGICQEASQCHSAKALQKLDLSYNRIRKIVSIYLPINLRLLDLKSNDITEFSFPETFLNNSVQVIVPKTLEVVDLSVNNIGLACPFIFYTTNFDNMPAFKLTNNPLTCSCETEFLATIETDFCLNPFKGSPSWPKQEIPAALKRSAQKNDLLDVSKLRTFDQFICATSYVNLANTCQCNRYGIYNSLCKFPCPSPCQCYLNSSFYSQFVNCTYRNLSVIPNRTRIRIQINVDFSNNNLKAIGPSSLASYSSSKNLYFQHNQISEIHPLAFRHVPEVEVLNLSCNLLSYLPQDVFRSQTKLSVLHLSRNKLRTIPSATFRTLGSLVMLTLDNNALTNMSVWSVQNPDGPKYFRMTLRNNPWSCECQYVNQFRNWLQNYSYMVDDSSKVFCQMMDGCTAQVPMISFNSSHCYSFPRTSATFANVAYWASSLAVILILVLMGTMGFVYRRQIQVIVYSRFGVRLFSKQYGDGRDMPYDAFIAYSSFDEEFVMQTFVPGLEQIEKPYRVCIHQRDFLAGAIISESIFEAIDKSKRTIIILSKHFVSSGWCRFEFKTAHMKMLADRCSRVIVVILDTVPQDLDSEMKLYVNTNTFLKWGDLLFWKKLYFAMPDTKPAITCDSANSIV